MKKIASAVLLCIVLLACAKSKKTNSSTLEDENAIRTLLTTQADAWSQYNLEGFMEGYWKSDSLKFYNSNGVSLGWDQTLANYKKRYPSKEHVGTLQFTVHDISKIEGDSYFVMGAYHLVRKVGNAEGIFMIILKKIEGEWKIIADTSCAPN